VGCGLLGVGKFAPSVAQPCRLCVAQRVTSVAGQHALATAAALPVMPASCNPAPLVRLCSQCPSRVVAHCPAHPHPTLMHSSCRLCRAQRPRLRPRLCAAARACAPLGRRVLRGPATQGGARRQVGLDTTIRPPSFLGWVRQAHPAELSCTASRADAGNTAGELSFGLSCHGPLCADARPTPPGSTLLPPAAPQPPACSPFVYVDAHILCTPAIADIDGDGSDELVVAVSYFFDRQYYEKEVGGALSGHPVTPSCDERCNPALLPGPGPGRASETSVPRPGWAPPAGASP
jgi:hypothetical protein